MGGPFSSPAPSHSVLSEDDDAMNLVSCGGERRKEEEESEGTRPQNSFSLPPLCPVARGGGWDAEIGGKTKGEDERGRGGP